MIESWLYAIISVIIVSLVSLIGLATISVKMENLRKVLLFLVSFSAGALLGGAFIHLLPEIAEEAGFGWTAGLYVLVGILVFFIIEKFVHWRHCHIPTCKTHPHHLATMNLVGDALHNFIDGLVIAGAYVVNVTLGITTTVAVLLHEIPQEIGDFGVLLYAGYSRKKALLYNFMIALTAVMGAIIGLVLASQFANITHFLIPFTAGGFIYIATADFIPELKKEVAPWKSALQLLGLVLGIGIMLLLIFL
ncbi:MAG: ZIP family metal transporter [archaeon]